MWCSQSSLHSWVDTGYVPQIAKSVAGEVLMSQLSALGPTSVRIPGIAYHLVRGKYVAPVVVVLLDVQGYSLCGLPYCC